MSIVNHTKRSKGEIAAKANNEYMGTELDPAEESKVISYLEANNLYGWAMSNNFQHLDLSG